MRSSDAGASRFHVGVAGWGLSRAVADRFPAEGTHLQRYAAVLPAVEINSCFYRHHRPETYAKWAASVPAGFRFSVKLPRAITHEASLEAWEPVLGRFLGEVSLLGEKLGCVLVQLPPKLAFDLQVAEVFFTALRAKYTGPLACEPRHQTWASDAAESLLREHGIARGADAWCILDNTASGAAVANAIELLDACHSSPGRPSSSS